MGAIRSLRLIEKRKESENVTSFVLAARDGGDLPPFEPGQHLPIEVPLPDGAGRLERTYSLSNTPDGLHYRISVKREPNGLVSNWLHDHLSPGDFLDARKPAGDFLLKKADRPIVLISAGVGVTPMVSMLGALAKDPSSSPVWFIHGARDGQHHPLAAEVRAIADSAAHVNVVIAYSQPGEDDKPRSDFDVEGRVDVGLVQRSLPSMDADYYLCGPVSFMTEIHEALIRRGAEDALIHVESFGPSN